MARATEGSRIARCEVECNFAMRVCTGRQSSHVCFAAAAVRRRARPERINEAEQ